ncbi:MAG: hypothetical protein M1837_003804 [Sclerophora amabilis]|nr:MAG: hypothetical protein M1837_003804 [Sclerophora amabilis]
MALLPSRLRRSSRTIRRFLPPLNFITVHYSYFVGLSLLASVVFWGASSPSRGAVSYVDSLFVVTSAMTLAGLSTINLSTLNTFQQLIVFLLIILGSAANWVATGKILVSAVVVHVRKRAFEWRFHHVVEKEKQERKSRSRSHAIPPRLSLTSSVRRESLVHPDNRSPAASPEASPQGQTSEDFEPRQLDPPSQLAEAPCSSSNNQNVDRDSPSTSANRSSRDVIRWSRGDNYRKHSPAVKSRSNHSRVLSMQGVGADPNAVTPSQVEPYPVGTHPQSHNDDQSCITLNDESNEKAHDTISYKFNGLIGRNSQFHRLSVAERERLGGVEYRAVSVLAMIVPLYFVLWQLLGCVGLGAWIARHKESVTRTNGLNPWWVGAFNGVSAFNNSGMSLLDANMIPFQHSTYLLITMGLMILAGNTCYPIFLRLIIWTFRHIPYLHEWHDTFQFLLDHPRRCYTNLFPSAHTWWLFFAVFTLNGIDWVAFEVLNLGNEAVTTLPPGARALDGLFQALAVRSGGFYVISISSLRIGLQALYVIMMYISAYPVVITMRNSNVYEERSLGIYADDSTSATDVDLEEKRTFSTIGSRLTASHQQGRTVPSYFVRQQLRAQLAHDLWLVAVAVLLITFIETSQFERDPKAYSVFNVIFEVVSAYGCVGISTGIPNEDYSFSGGCHKLTKIILCAVMIRGRHRGLPVAIDRAVLLPGEQLAAAEEEDAIIRTERTQSRGRHV